MYNTKEGVCVSTQRHANMAVELEKHSLILSIIASPQRRWVHLLLSNEGRCSFQKYLLTHISYHHGPPVHHSKGRRSMIFVQCYSLHLIERNRWWYSAHQSSYNERTSVQGSKNCVLVDDNVRIRSHDSVWNYAHVLRLTIYNYLNCSF